jgi:hypothetical protein
MPASLTPEDSIDPRAGVDQSILDKLDSLKSELEQLLAVHPFRQDFQAIWLLRDQLSKVQRVASGQAKRHAEERSKQRRAAEADESRKQLERQALQESQRLAAENQRIDAERRAAAAEMIVKHSLILCRECRRGRLQMECADCSGTGEGLPRYVSTSAPAVCADMRSTCALCGGTGVFMGRTKTLVTTCATCSGKGEVDVECSKCNGTQILSASGTRFSVTGSMRDLIISHLVWLR